MDRRSAHLNANDREVEPSAFAPLKFKIFRNIWWASVLANFGQLILGVGAAWEMTRMTDSPTMVALVQTAIMLPLMLVTVPAGALADMFDRRKVCMAGLAISALSGCLLTILAFLGLATPWLLLAFCFLIGAGVALYAPSWQASISEMVPGPMLPPAVALGAVSYNIARSVGPAIGGAVILALGVKATFAMNGLSYIPLLLAFFFWQRLHVPSRLPPERTIQAIMSGIRYVTNSQPVRNVLFRSLAFGLAFSSAVALAPLAAKYLLDGSAGIFGLLLGSMGVGAIIGALFVTRIRNRFGTERAVQIAAVVTGLALILIGVSRSLPLSLLGFALVGAGNITSISLLNVTIQLAVPRWVVARSLSLFTASLTGGVALGAWAWGEVAAISDVGISFVISGVYCAATAALGYLFPVTETSHKSIDSEPVELKSTLDVAMPLTMRSGPIIIEIDYDVDPNDARSFYSVMLKIQRIRQRNGGFQWSLSRNIADPAIWTERYHCPTWGDYLRMRDRWTQADRIVQEEADRFHSRQEPPMIRRRLERPFGSVRWKADTPDTGHDNVGSFPHDVMR